MIEAGLLFKPLKFSDHQCTFLSSPLDSAILSLLCPAPSTLKTSACLAQKSNSYSLDEITFHRRENEGIERSKSSL